MDAPASTPARRRARMARLAQVPPLLADGHVVTADTIAAQLGVSTRTVYRYMADLVDGRRIRGEAGIGYVMREGAAS